MSGMENNVKKNMEKLAMFDSFVLYLQNKTV